MPSWLPFALSLLLGASSAAWAAEQAAPDRQGEPLVAPAVAPDHGLGVELASKASGAAGAESIREERDLEARLDSLKRPGRERRRSPLEVRLGRTPAAGRSPGDAPPLYGEVGIDIDAIAGLSLVPSYRVVLPDHDAEESESSAAQVLKLGARFRF